jgi:hypothetical protein
LKSEVIVPFVTRAGFASVPPALAMPAHDSARTPVKEMTGPVSLRSRGVGFMAALGQLVRVWLSEVRDAEGIVTA